MDLDLLLVIAVLLAVFSRADSVHHRCDSRRNIIVTFSPYMGYRNQMDTVAKAMFIGSLTNRSVCIPHFNSDYRVPADISPHYFINLNQTNANLAKLIRSVHFGKTQKEVDMSPPTTSDDILVMGINEAAKSKCICLLLQGPGAPGSSNRRCTYGARDTTIMIRNMDKNYTNLLDFIQRPDIRNINSLCLSPGMPYGNPVRPEHEAYSRQVKRALVHHDVMGSIANYVKAKEGICKEKCTGQEMYISTHPRFEDDFVGQFQMLTGFWQKRGVNYGLNNAIIDSFLHDFQTFLNDFLISVNIIHISTGLGKGAGKEKGQKHLNDFLIKNYYERRFHPVSSYHYEYLDHIREVAHHTNHSSHFESDAPDIPDPHNVTHHISKSELITFHHIMAGINTKKSIMRDLHAVIDFLIASQATFFYGVCASSFTVDLLSFVDIGGCFTPDSDRLHNLTATDFGLLTKKIDTLRKNSTAFFEQYSSNDMKYI